MIMMIIITIIIMIITIIIIIMTIITIITIAITIILIITTSRGPECQTRELLPQPNLRFCSSILAIFYPPLK